MIIVTLVFVVVERKHAAYRDDSSDADFGNQQFEPVSQYDSEDSRDDKNIYGAKI